MTKLCEVKSLTIYRNISGQAIYLTAIAVGDTTTFLAKITLKELPHWILDRYIYLNLSDIIGQQKISEKQGKFLKQEIIDRYQLKDITNYDRTQTLDDIKCESSMEK